MPSLGNKVLISGTDRAMSRNVTGTSRSAVYFTEEAKTVLVNSGSVSGFSLEKTGNRAVAIGVETNVNRTAKLLAEK